jgi:hypothetical protein
MLDKKILEKWDMVLDNLSKDDLLVIKDKIEKTLIKKYDIKME